MSEQEKKCQWCGKEGAETYHQHTQHVEEERNWVTLCAECRKENDEYWADMLADYYSDCF